MGVEHKILYGYELIGHMHGSGMPGYLHAECHRVVESARIRAAADRKRLGLYSGALGIDVEELGNELGIGGHEKTVLRVLMGDLHAQRLGLSRLHVVGGKRDGMAHVYLEIDYAVLVPVDHAGIESEPAGCVGYIKPHILAVQPHAKRFMHCVHHHLVLALKRELGKHGERGLYGIQAMLGH